MPKTMLDNLAAQAASIQAEALRLLGEFSGMHPHNKPNDEIFFLDGSGNQSWNELPPEAKQIQAQLLPKYDRFSSLIKALTQGIPEAARQQVGYSIEHLRGAISQDSSTWWETPEEAVKGFQEEMAGILRTLSDHFGISREETIVIPDTNALLFNPDIENWRFDGIARFELTLAPTVLAELDGHKVNHRNASVRQKAETLIRKIKEYRRRGAVHDGVPIVNNTIQLRAFAVEPDMSATLPWLDPASADDRFLATVLQVIRENMGKCVFLTTRDINMQNKAEFAGIPFEEPPAPKTL